MEQEEKMMDQEGAEFALPEMEAPQELLEETPAQEPGVTQAEAAEADTPETAEEPAADFAAQVRQVQALYPDFQEMPEEVAAAVAAGAELLTAYTAYRTREAAAAAVAIRKENEVLRHNAASAARAPVTSAVGGGETHTASERSLLAGFADDTW